MDDAAIAAISASTVAYCFVFQSNKGLDVQ